MEHVWSVLCRSSSVDRDNNQISLFDVAEGFEVYHDGEITDADVPGIPINLTLVTMLWRTDLDKEEIGYLKMEIAGPDDTPLDVKTPEVTINLTGNHKRFRTRTFIIGFPNAGSGVYRFAVFIRSEGEEQWTKAASIPFELSMRSSSNIDEIDPSKRILF